MYSTDSDTIKICWYWPNTDTDTWPYSRNSASDYIVFIMYYHKIASRIFKTVKDSETNRNSNFKDYNAGVICPKVSTKSCL